MMTSIREELLASVDADWPKIWELAQEAALAAGGTEEAVRNSEAATKVIMRQTMTQCATFYEMACENSATVLESAIATNVEHWSPHNRGLLDRTVRAIRNLPKDGPL